MVLASRPFQDKLYSLIADSQSEMYMYSWITALCKVTGIDNVHRCKLKTPSVFARKS